MLRERYIDIMEKTVAVYTEEQIRDYIESVYKTGAEKAARLASRTLSKVHRKIGFVNR